MPKKGYKQTEAHATAHRLAQGKGHEHHLWKGDKVSYSQYHVRVRTTLGKAIYCSNKKNGCMGTSKIYEWANLTGKYKDLRDYKQLCRVCHRKFDSGKRKGCKRGHSYTEKNTRITKDGYRVCRACEVQNYRKRLMKTKEK